MKKQPKNPKLHIKKKLKFLKFFKIFKLFILPPALSFDREWSLANQVPILDDSRTLSAAIIASVGLFIHLSTLFLAKSVTGVSLSFFQMSHYCHGVGDEKDEDEEKGEKFHGTLKEFRLSVVY